ncbi:GNAT family N-acetyltransferase [Pseudomonas syringae]|uniref:GNAT family N-acetyltransferase n=1 Tax=Pseudomonas syringae TaxID=317 RepID=UPI001916F9E0|nr:GNAT family N-acetyltransferase [Pseudomonas syringae]QQQ51592.1 GNAT family N-acetyltransferase [Pseudomonas syringae]
MNFRTVHPQDIPNIFEGVLSIGKECAKDLMKFKIGINHVFYEFSKAWVISELSLHLAFCSSVDSPHKIIVAETEHDGLLGFATYTASISHPTACGINYIAVRPEMRRHGIMRRFIEVIQNDFHHVSLSCDIEIVDFYLNLGFEIQSPENTQISLAINPINAIMPILSEDGVMSHPTLADERRRLNKVYGKKLKKLEKNYHDSKRRVEKEIIAYMERYKSVNSIKDIINQP